MISDGIDKVSVPPIPLAQLPAAQDLFSILVLSDLHIPSAKGQQKLLLENREFLDRHDWVMLLGDVTACYGTPAEYGQVNSFIETLDRPYSVINGNHEFSFALMLEESGQYGKIWERSSPAVQRSQLRRFNRFYGIDSCFQTARHDVAAFVTLGVDGIGDDDSGLLNDDHERWFAQSLERSRDLPLLVFAHFPLQDSRLDRIRYYEPGRRAYYIPGPTVRRELESRSHPTFWFSGHLHFRPSHSLFEPYETEMGVWQLHCPDSRGYGRANNQHWSPQHYDGLFVRSVHLDSNRLSVITTDLYNGIECGLNDFDLVKSDRVNGARRPQPNLAGEI
jgi:hypothetical protein